MYFLMADEPHNQVANQVIARRRGLRCNICHFRVQPNVIAVIDLSADELYGEYTKAGSITNDVENVVKYLVQKGHLTSNATFLLYRDSEGGWDQILHRDGVFAGFRSGGRLGHSARSIREAIANIINRGRTGEGK